MVAMRKILILMVMFCGLLGRAEALTVSRGSGGGGTATITRESFAEHALDAGDNSYAWSVTIPANTTAIVMVATGYGWTANPVTSANLNGTQSFTVDVNLYTNAARGVGVGHLFSPGATGAQTINVTIGAHGYGVYVWLIFYSGTATDGLRDSDTSATTSIALTTTSGDMVVACAIDEENTAISWTNATEIDEYAAPASYGNAIAQLTADGVSETVSTSGSNVNMGAIVLKPGAL